MVVEHRDDAAGLQHDVVLPLEVRARAEPEARVLAAEGPLDLARLDVDQVGGPGVPHGDEEASVADQLDRVDVVGVPREAVGRQRGIGVPQRDVPVLDRIPAVEQLAGPQVVLLHRRVVDRAVVGATVLGEVDRYVLVRGRPRRRCREITNSWRVSFQPCLPLSVATVW